MQNYSSTPSVTCYNNSSQTLKVSHLACYNERYHFMGGVKAVVTSQTPKKKRREQREGQKLTSKTPFK